eukprot:scaffold11244_cov75-Cyclotella_meneghiniana.AAC.1
MGGDNFGSSTLRFTPRWSMFGLIQEVHNISTLPTPHYKYDEWLEKVEIGIWALKWSPQRVFQSRVGSQLAWPLCPLFTPRLSEFRNSWPTTIITPRLLSHGW